MLRSAIPAAAILAATLSGCSAGNLLGPSGPPSILWITLDTVRADHLRLYGGRAAMPNLERYAASAAVFDSAWSHFPETPQEHWVMFTSALPGAHGEHFELGPSAWQGPTLTKIVKTQGYATAAIIGGPSLVGRERQFDVGFDLFDDAVPIGPEDKRPSPDITRAGLSWLSRQSAPWFLFLHYFDAHTPYLPQNPRMYDPDYQGTFDGSSRVLDYPMRGGQISARDLAHAEALYDAELTEMDVALGKVFDALEGDEIVVITSDHGESFDHGYLFNHCEVLYDSVLRVPLIVGGPGVKPGHVAGVVTHVDVLPTVLSLAGLPQDPRFMGRVVLPSPPAADSRVYSRARGGDRLVSSMAVRTGTQKAIWWADGRSMAYNLLEDPLEQHPLDVPAALLDAPETLRKLETAWPLAVVAGPGTLDPALREKLQQLGYSHPEGAASRVADADGGPGSLPPDVETSGAPSGDPALPATEVPDLPTHAGAPQRRPADPPTRSGDRQP